MPATKSVEPEAVVKTAVADAEFDTTGFDDQPLVVDLKRQSTREDGKPLPLPTPADPETAFYAVKVEGKPGARKEEGWQAVAGPSLRKTELADPRAGTDRLYPAIVPGYKYDEELFQNPAKNVIVKTKEGLKTKLEALASGVAHSVAIQVERRAWRKLNTADEYLWEDPLAAASHATKTRPVVDVTLWCPELTAQNPKEPHGPYLGVGETRERNGKPGTGRCPRCTNDAVRANVVTKIAWLQKGGVI